MKTIWKWVAPAVFGLSTLSTGCATSQPAPQPAPAHEEEEAVVEAPEGPPAEVEVSTAPPPDRVEEVPVSPGGDVVWVKGHWHWNGRRWGWRRGHYARVHPGLHYVPAHYAQRGNYWYYVGGHWAR